MIQHPLVLDVGSSSLWVIFPVLLVLTVHVLVLSVPMLIVFVLTILVSIVLVLTIPVLNLLLDVGSSSLWVILKPVDVGSSSPWVIQTSYVGILYG